jgi:hypothetical protein
MIGERYQPREVDDEDDLLYDDPYPLGAPNRVIEAYDRQLERLCPSLDSEPEALLTLACNGMTLDDQHGIEDRIAELMRGTEPEVTRSVIHFIAQHRRPDTTHVLLGYSPVKGWCVRMEARP